MTSRRMSPPVAMLLVSLTALAIYANSLFNRFAYDDEPIIVANPRVHQLADQASIWLTPYWPEHGAAAGLYRPFAIFSWALQWAAGGGSPVVFHVVSVLLHALVSLFALLLLRRLVNAHAALAGALIFAVHPVHTEAVANVVGQAELLAAAATLLACLVHLRSRSAPWRLPALALLYALGMLAKESAVVLPALLVVLDFASGRVRADRQSLRAYVRSVAPVMGLLAAVAAAWLMLRVHVLGSIAGSNPAPYLPFLQESAARRLLTALAAWPHLLRLLLWPADLSADYSPAVIVPPTGIDASVVAGALLLFAIVALTVMLPRRPVAASAAWLFIAFLPVSNLILPVGVILAERTLYLPSFAVALAAAQLLDARAQRSAAAVRWAPAAVAAIVLLAGLRSTARNPAWRDTAAYTATLIREHPESYRAQRAAGEALFAQGDLAGARRYLELARDTWPHDADLQNALGTLYLRTGEVALAISAMERAREVGHASPAHARNLGIAYLAAKRYGDALEMTRDLEGAAGAGVRAQALHGLGRHAEAAAEWRTALAASTQPNWLAWLHRARSLALSGEVNSALAAADTGRSVAPDPVALATTDSVRWLIQRGCWGAAAPQGESCTDPLEPRGIVVMADQAGAKGIATASDVAAQPNGHHRRRYRGS